MDERKRRSGQQRIPAFGNWDDMADEMPITQYFACARHPALLSYSSSSAETDPSLRGGAADDPYSLDFNKPPPSTLKKGIRNRERKCPHNHHVKDNGGKMRSKQQGSGKVWDVTEPQQQPRKKKKQQQQQQHHQNDTVPHRTGRRLPIPNPKPVDEDLYKIPPELLRTTKRKKVLGFISKCLVPAACVS